MKFKENNLFYFFENVTKPMTMNNAKYHIYFNSSHPIEWGRAYLLTQMGLVKKSQEDYKNIYKLVFKKIVNKKMDIKEKKWIVIKRKKYTIEEN